MTLAGATVASVWGDIFHHPDDEAVLEDTLNTSSGRIERVVQDGLSRWAGFREVCPRIGAQTGIHFPLYALSGNCVPELRLGMGCTFRLRALAESATRNLLLKWDALSQQALKRKLRPIPKADSGTRFPDAKKAT